MAFVFPLSLLNREGSSQQPSHRGGGWGVPARPGPLKSQRAKHSPQSDLQQGREGVAEGAAAEVRLLPKKVDGFSKWVLAAIGVTCISKLLCGLYSPEVDSSGECHSEGSSVDLALVPSSPKKHTRKQSPCSVDDLNCKSARKDALIKAKVWSHCGQKP